MSVSSCCTFWNTSGEHQEASRRVFLLSSLTLQKDWVPCLSAKPNPAKGFLFAYLPKSLNQNSPRFQHWIWSQMSKIICLSVIVFLYSCRISSKWDFTLCLLYSHVPGSFPRTCCCLLIWHLLLLEVPCHWCWKSQLFFTFSVCVYVPHTFADRKACEATAVKHPHFPFLAWPQRWSPFLSAGPLVML